MAHFARIRKIAFTASALTGSGALYLFRDELKPYFNTKYQINSKTQENITQDDASQATTLIDHLPQKVPYLLVGGGTASHSAMRAIRGHDPKAKVLIITGENYNPYMRPALSKELWLSERDLRSNLTFRWWNGKERSIFFEIDEFFIPLQNLIARETGGVSIIKNVRLNRLDPEKKIAYLNNGQSLEYEKCLLATGGKPKILPEFENVTDDVKERILYFRTADDFLKLDKISETAKRIVIVGGGFLGSELACSLSNRGDEPVPQGQIIYQIFPDSGNLAKILPPYLSEYVTGKIKQEGTHIIPDVDVTSVKKSGDNSVVIKLTNGESIYADYIVCAVGLEPEVELAKQSGLEVDEKTGGYLVNSELEARTDVWVAGDASCFYDIKLGRRRVEHHDHAINSGRLAGQNMVGFGKPYTHQSMFWSDLGSDISFEAIGIIDSNLETVAVFADVKELIEEQKNKQETELKNDKLSGEADNQQDKLDTNNRKPLDEGDKYAKGVVFYLKDGIIVGVLMWNLFNRLSIARRILNEQSTYDDFNEVAKMFNIYLDD